MKLTQVFQKIIDDTQGKTSNLHQVVQKLESRGFGPLIIAPALLAILPTGAIPGIPSFCALTILLISGQMIMGKRHPWLPKKLKEIEFEREKLSEGLNKFLPVTQKIDSVFKPRFENLTHDTAKRLIALLVSVNALMMIPLEVVPFAAALPATAIIALGLGVSTEDGLMTVLGGVISIVSAYMVYTSMFS